MSACYGDFPPVAFIVYSFATSVALANGVSIENVAKMLGHSDTKMTRHYARVLDKSIMRDMTIVNGKFAASATKQTATDVPSQTQDPAQAPNTVAIPVSSAIPSIEIPTLTHHSRSGVVN